MAKIVPVTIADVITISVAIAAAEPSEPASSSCRMEMAARIVFGEYRKTTQEIVVIALTK